MKRVVNLLFAVVMVSGSAATAATCDEMREFLVKSSENIQKLQGLGRPIRKQCIKFGCEGRKIKKAWKKQSCKIPSVGLQNRLDKIKDSCDRILEFDNLDDLCINAAQ